MGRHSKLLWSLATFALLDVGMNLVAGFDLSMIDQVDGRSYPFSSVVWDLAVLSCLRALVVFLVVWTYSGTNGSGSKSHALPNIIAGNQPLITNSQDSTAPPSFRFRSRNLSARVAANVLLVVALFVQLKTFAFDRWGWPAGAMLVGGLIFSVLHLVLVILLKRAESQAVAAAAAAAADVESNSLNAAHKAALSIIQLLRVLKPYFWPKPTSSRVRVASAWFFLGLSKGSNVVAPLCFGAAVNRLKDDDLQHVVMLVAGYVALKFCNTTLKEAQNLVYLKVKQQAGFEIQQLSLKHLLALSYEWHVSKQLGEVTNAISRGVSASNNVVQYLFMYLLPTIAEAAVVCVIFAEHFSQPELAGIAVAGIVLYGSVTLQVTMWRMQFRKKMNKHDNDSQFKMTDALVNFETVKSFTAEEHEVARYSESVAQYQQENTNTQATLSLLNITQQLILNITLASCLIFAAYQVDSGELDVGSFVSISVYIAQLFAPLSFLGTIYSTIITSFVDMENLSNILAEEKDVEDAPDARELPAVKLDQQHPAIEFRGVCFDYRKRGAGSGLNKISFSVPVNTTTAIVGSTGAGKSTITRLLLRYYDVLSGQVLVGGIDVQKLKQKSLRQCIGVVPQDTSLFNDTVMYNLSYGLYGSRDAHKIDISEQMVMSAAKSAELDVFIEQNLPKKWETKVGERGQQISGGEKQRVAIARVLLKNPPIAVLDEATSHLDSTTEMLIQNSLQRLGAERTMLVIAHRLSTIASADQILVLNQGQIIEKGTHEELMDNGEWHESCYASLWNRQVREKVEEPILEVESSADEAKKANA